MKTAKEYLRDRDLLSESCNEWIITFTESGRKVNIVNLLEEYASQPKWISVEDALPEH